MNINDFKFSCDFSDFHAVNTIQLCELAEIGFFDLTREDWDFGPKFSAEQHARLCRKITQHYWFREIAIIPPGIWKTEFLRFMNEIMPKYMPWYEMLNNPEFEVGVVSEFTVGNEHETGSGTRDENEQQTGTSNGTSSGSSNVTETGNNDEYFKGRNIFSDFPQTQLQGSNQDYASTGTDNEYERINENSKNTQTTTQGSTQGNSEKERDTNERRSHLNDIVRDYRKRTKADPLTIIEQLKQWDDVEATIVKEIEPLFSCLLTVNINAW